MQKLNHQFMQLVVRACKYLCNFQLIRHRRLQCHLCCKKSSYLREDTLTNRYNKEYEQYYLYALEQFLIKKYGYTEQDAKVKVVVDFEDIKQDFENKETI